MDPRKATASVSYNGKRIDTKLAEYLQSFSYTDVASGESDSLSLNINDRDRKWIKSWFPSKGDTMAATIIMKNWSKEGDTQKLSCRDCLLGLRGRRPSFTTCRGRSVSKTP